MVHRPGPLLLELPRAGAIFTRPPRPPFHFLTGEA